MTLFIDGPSTDSIRTVPSPFFSMYIPPSSSHSFQAYDKSVNCGDSFELAVRSLNNNLLFTSMASSQSSSQGMLPSHLLIRLGCCSQFAEYKTVNYSESGYLKVDGCCCCVTIDGFLNDGEPVLRSKYSCCKSQYSSPPSFYLQRLHHVLLQFQCCVCCDLQTSSQFFGCMTLLRSLILLAYSHHSTFECQDDSY